jgi:hypothetical protein
MDSLTYGPFRLNPPGPKPQREFLAYFLEGRLVSHVGFNFANAPPAVAPAINGQGSLLTSNARPQMLQEVIWLTSAHSRPRQRSWQGSVGAKG